LNEFDEDTGQTTTDDLARGVSRYGHIGESRETVGHWGFKDDEPDEGDRRGTGRGRRTTNWTRTTNRTRTMDDELDEDHGTAERQGEEEENGRRRRRRRRRREGGGGRRWRKKVKKKFRVFFVVGVLAFDW
jgi:hypothetical protein